MTPTEALEEAKRRAGSGRQLALKLGIAQQAVAQWRRVPAERAVEIARLTGVALHDLRPDLYPPDLIKPSKL